MREKLKTSYWPQILKSQEFNVIEALSIFIF